MRRCLAATVLCAVASVAATAQTPASITLPSRVSWIRVTSGVDRAEVSLPGKGEAWSIRLILVRVDPSHTRATLIRSTRDNGTLGAWTVDSLPRNAIVGVNAGQFASGRPWGWLVRDGVEEQPPGIGPLSLAVVALADGRVHLVPYDSIIDYRGRVVQAFQSYPTLLESGGLVPLQIHSPEQGSLDLEHRDSRVALCELPDHRLIIALTRFEGLGGVLSELPFGPTIPEMSAIMLSLGCSAAVSLDGGISGQLVIREGKKNREWRGLRRVPLALAFFLR
jgi:exopolysaccharide biosynthesis protein